MLHWVMSADCLIDMELKHQVMPFERLRSTPHVFMFNQASLYYDIVSNQNVLTT